MDTNTNYQDTLNFLVSKYGVSMNRLQTAEALNIAVTTLDLHQRQGLSPKCKRIGAKVRPRVVYPTVEVAKFLTSDLVEVI